MRLSRDRHGTPIQHSRSEAGDEQVREQASEQDEQVDAIIAKSTM